MKTTNNLKYEELASVWKVFLFFFIWNSFSNPKSLSETYMQPFYPKPVSEVYMIRFLFCWSFFVVFWGFFCVCGVVFLAPFGIS